MAVLGIAFTLPPAVGLIVVVTVGVGMAFPYLLLSGFPELARRFPRTGPWAELVKQFMGFLLLAVAVFFGLRWVGRVVGGEHNAWWVIYGILVAGAVFLVVKSLRYAKTRVAPTVAVIIALLLVVPTFFVTWQLTGKPYEWEAYTPEGLARARAADEVVLIDFTADWCANCKTVEAFVLNRGSVKRAVADHGVRMIKADLTDSHAPGQKLLGELKGKGIPLTVIYSPSLKEPIRLTGIYSVDDLKEALDRAAQGASRRSPRRRRWRGNDAPAARAAGGARLSTSV